MRCVVQRVSFASVTVDGNIIGKIDKGIMALIGFNDEDNKESMKYILDKIVNLRIFEDEDEKINLSLEDIGGEVLIVPNFTIYGDARKGRRPSFFSGAAPDIAEKMYDEFVDLAKKEYGITEFGEFQAHMDVEIINDGPVTILIDSEKVF